MRDDAGAFTLREESVKAPARGAANDRGVQSTLEIKWRAGAVWFYWAAALAIAAAVLHAYGQNWAGFLSLGVLQSPVTAALRAGNGVAALAIAVTFLVFIGWFAGAGQTWAFVLGMLAYAGDGALFAMNRQWLAVALHVIILFFIYPGMIAAGMRRQNASLERDLAIRAALAKDRATRPAAPETVVKPSSADPLDAPRPFRPGVSAPPPEEE